jgi:hypothetical protein
LSVLTVTRNFSWVEQADRVLGDRRRGPGLQVRRGAHLQRDPLVTHVRRQPAERDRPVRPATLTSSMMRTPWPEPVGAAPLQRLPDRRQPERLAGVDGEVLVLAPEVLEGVQVTGGREARLGAGDVEADDALSR